MLSNKTSLLFFYIAVNTISSSRQSQAETKRTKLSSAFLYVCLVDSFASTKERYVSNCSYI